MSKTTRERIRITIQKHGYRPSLMARGLKSKRSYLIGVVMPQVHRTVSSHSIRGICMACSNTMYSPIIVSIEDSMENEPRKIQELLDHRVDGMLTFTGSSTPYYEQVAQAGIPVVQVDRCASPCSIDQVYINHYDIVQEALLNLSVSGYTKIALFSDHFTSPYSTVRIRRQAYFDFINNNSSIPPMEYTINFSDSGSVTAAVQNYLERTKGEHAAIFVPSMENLATLDWICKLLGLRYPDDIAILGYALDDDIMPFSSKLSVISQPLAEMCNASLDLLMSRIAGNMLPETPIVKKIPATLIIRESTIL